MSMLINSVSQMLWGAPVPKKEAEANAKGKQDDNVPVLKVLNNDYVEIQQKAPEKKGKGQHSSAFRVEGRSYADALKLNGWEPVKAEEPWEMVEDLNRTDDV